MAEFLDTLSHWFFIAGAIAGAITWAIAMAHRISREELPLWQVANFRWWLAATVLGIGVALLSGQGLTLIARREVSALLNNTPPKKVFIYADGRAILQTPDFIRTLKNLDAGESAGQRFGRSSYEMVLVSGHTLTRFSLSQSSEDSTLYKVGYPKYDWTSTNGIGVIKAEHILLK